MAAIYQWFDIYEEVYTTTLYPLELGEGLSVTIAFDEGFMRPITENAIEYSHQLLAGTLRVLLLTAPEQEDEIEYSHQLLAGTLRQLLLSAPEQVDEIEYSHQLLGGTLEVLLITAWMPPQGIYVTCDIDQAGCYLTSI
jgi:hypothetical protein